MESGGFDFHIVFHSIPFLAKGMGLTLLLTVLGIAGGLVFGTVLALARLAPFKVLSFAAGTYVNFFRSMPLILVPVWTCYVRPKPSEAWEGFPSCDRFASVVAELDRTRGSLRPGLCGLGHTAARTIRATLLPSAVRRKPRERPLQAGLRAHQP